MVKLGLGLGLWLGFRIRLGSYARRYPLAALFRHVVVTLFSVFIPCLNNNSVFVSMFLNPAQACDTFQDVEIKYINNRRSHFSSFLKYFIFEKERYWSKHKRRNQKFEKWRSRLFP